MNTTFYRAWLPISLAVHVVLLFVLNIVPFGVTRVGGTNTYIPVGIVQAAPPPAPPAPPRPAVKPLPPPTVKPVAADQRFTPNAERQPVLPKNVPPGNQSIDPSIRTGNASKPGNGTINKEEGPGIGAKAPPSIMRAKSGTGFDAPAGIDGGMGTKGEGTGESGPSYGAKARYGRVEGMSKLAAEVLPNGTVAAIFSVRVSETGSISSVTKTKSTGNDDVDSIASRLVRSRDYDPAKKNGKVVEDTVRVKVEFNNGRYTVEEM
ncbi:MAG: energy transducer TonB [Armatimonadota bacterium]